MSTYQNAADHYPDIYRRVQAAAKQHRADLIEAGVTIGVVMAFAKRGEDGHPVGPAIKHGGYAAAGLMKINSIKLRVEGLPDCTMTLDGDLWQEWPEARRDAVIHHELLHPLLTREQNGRIRTDDIGRPKLKNRLHDIQLGGFALIAKTYGDDAPEVELARLAVQLLLPGFEADVKPKRKMTV